MMVSLAAVAAVVLAAARHVSGQNFSVPRNGSTPGIVNTDTSLTLIYQNNLNLTDDRNHVGAILLDSMPPDTAAGACAAIGETLLPRATIAAHYDDFLNTLSYNAWVGRADSLQNYMIEGGMLSVLQGMQQMTYQINLTELTPMPVLCTQSSNSNQAGNAKATDQTQISVVSNGATYVGYRNMKSFRFLGIPFAEPPVRFEYPVMFNSTNKTIQATAYQSQCIQNPGGGSEDCLFLNVWTPYIPKVGSKSDLRPVLIWLHGGGFTGGSGSALDTDGGQLASREDIVTVTLNYRLSTLGFLAVPGTNITGNYGIADQNLALQWVLDNIANFGGDPAQVTFNGASAGAASVRVHLGSPLAIGKFQGAIAMSSLGGGVDLGLGGNYATQYSAYPTIEESFNLSRNLFAEAGCNQTDNTEKVVCLKGISAGVIVNLTTVSRYVVQDGKYVVTPELVVDSPNNNTANVPIIFGIAANDGASFSTYPKTDVANETEGLQAALGISAEAANSIIASGLFPYENTFNVTFDSFNVSQRVATDNQFRCIDQASAYAGGTRGAFKAAYYYQNDRTNAPGGYDPNGLGGPPTSPDFPLGNPNLPYFRLHGSDQDWQFGFLQRIREPADLYAVQMAVGLFAEFIRSGQPNPSEDYLGARGYDNIVVGLRQSGRWEPIVDENGPIRKLDWPGMASDFEEKPQCAFLNYSISYYTNGNRV